MHYHHLLMKDGHISEFDFFFCFLLNGIFFLKKFDQLLFADISVLRFQVTAFYFKGLHERMQSASHIGLNEMLNF